MQHIERYINKSTSQEVIRLNQATHMDDISTVVVLHPAGHEDKWFTTNIIKFADQYERIN